MTVKESVLHVQLMNGPGVGGGDAKDDTYRGRLDDQAERLVVVDAVLLREAPNYPASFVAGKRTIGVEFMFKSPLARNHVSVGRSRDETPHPIVDQCSELDGHGKSPIGV